MEIIRSSLGDDFDLRAGVSSLLSVVGGRGHHNLLDGFLIRRDYGGSAVAQTIYAYSVEVVIVCGYALTVGNDLHLVFGLKDGAIGLSRPNLLRQGKRVSIALARIVAKHAR